MNGTFAFPSMEAMKTEQQHHINNNSGGKNSGAHHQKQPQLVYTKNVLLLNSVPQPCSLGSSQRDSTS